MIHMASVFFQDLQLPFDVVETIIESLDVEEDDDTLFSCTHTSRAFRDLSLRRLFHSATFAYAIKADRVGQPLADICAEEAFKGRNLVRVLRHSPQLHRHVRVVRILFTRMIEEMIAPTGFVESRMANILHLLPFLNNLEQISFPGPGNDVSRGLVLAWSSVPENMQRAFIKFMQAKEVTHLNLNGILDFPTSLFSQFPSVTSLSLLPAPSSGPIFNNFRAPVATNLTDKIFLTTLELGAIDEMDQRRRSNCTSPWDSTVRWFKSRNCVIKLDSLKVLKMPILHPQRQGGRQDIYHVLEFCARSLERLVLRTVHGVHERQDLHMPPKIPPLDLTSLHRLRSLSISAIIFGGVRFGIFDSPLPWIEDTLRSLSQATCFEDQFTALTLHFELQGFPVVDIPRLDLGGVVEIMKPGRSESYLKRKLIVHFYDAADEKGRRKWILEQHPDLSMV